MKGNLLLLVVALVASLYASELVLHVRDRLFVEGLPVALVEERCPGAARVDHQCIEAIRQDTPFDARSAFQVFRESAELGDTIWPAVPATLFGPDEGLEITPPGDSIRTVLPLAGISRVSTLLCNESGDWVTYLADEHGFNNRAGLHTLESVDVVVVGDSFVHGWCVPREASIAGLLESELGTVLGVGLEGSGPLAQLGLLREFARPLRPAVVLWFHFGENDLGDLERESKTPILRRYLDPTFRQGLATVQPEVDRGLREVVQRRREEEEARLLRRGQRARTDRLGRGSPLISFALLRRLRGLIGGASASPWQRDYPWDPAAFREVVEQTRSEVESWNGRLVFVYLPAWRRFAHPEHASPHKDAVLALAQELGLDVVDPTPAFSAHAAPLSLFPFGVDGHYTEEGVQILVEEVLEELQR